MWRERGRQTATPPPPHSVLEAHMPRSCLPLILPRTLTLTLTLPLPLPLPLTLTRCAIRAPMRRGALARCRSRGGAALAPCSALHATRQARGASLQPCAPSLQPCARYLQPCAPNLQPFVRSLQPRVRCRRDGRELMRVQKHLGRAKQQLTRWALMSIVGLQARPSPPCPSPPALKTSSFAPSSAYPPPPFS